jgi:DnaD/phage-associated family protein
MILLPEDKSIVSLLDAKDAQSVLLALVSDESDMPNLSQAANIVFTAIKVKSDRISVKQSENGRKGGRPKATESQKSQRNPQNPTEPTKATESQKSLRTSSVTVTDTVTEPVDVTVVTSDAGTDATTAPLREVFEIYTQRINFPMSPRETQMILDAYKAGLDPPLIFHAIKTTAENPEINNKFRYIEKVLHSWQSEGITSLAIFEQHEQTRSNRQNNVNGGYANASNTTTLYGQQVSKSDADRELMSHFTGINDS